MSGLPSDRDQGTDRMVAQSQGNKPTLATAHTRSRLKGFLAPFVLALFGVALFVGAFLLYPSTPEGSTPDFNQVFIYSSNNIAIIRYQVVQRPGVAEVRISLKPYGRVPSGGTFVGLQVIPPYGTVFVDCPSSACSRGEWGGTVRLTSDSKFATAEFDVKASDFGVTANGVTAAAAIPEIDISGRVHDLVTLYTEYYIPSAGSYDWSSFPTYAVSNTTAVWNETLVSGDTAGRAVVGINHAAQADDDTRTFIAGALLGLAGAAVLAAVIEALHVRDWAEFRALRSK